MYCSVLLRCSLLYQAGSWVKIRPTSFPGSLLFLPCWRQERKWRKKLGSMLWSDYWILHIDYIALQSLHDWTIINGGSWKGGVRDGGRGIDFSQSKFCPNLLSQPIYCFWPNSYPIPILFVCYFQSQWPKSDSRSDTIGKSQVQFYPFMSLSRESETLQGCHQFVFYGTESI